MNLLVIPFLEKYVQPYSCKTKEFQIFKDICLRSELGHQKSKETLIEMVKLAYTLSGKGKNRKRTLEEVIEIINDKTNYFDKIKNNSINPNINCNNNEI